MKKYTHKQILPNLLEVIFGALEAGTEIIGAEKAKEITINTLQLAIETINEAPKHTIPTNIRIREIK